MVDPEEYITTERIGIVVYTLMNPRGRKYTTAALARRVGVAHRSMWRTLDKLARVLPLCRDLDGWFMLEE